MVKKYPEFKVKIKSEKIIVDNIPYDKVAYVSFYDKQNKKTEEQKFRYVSGEEIYELIKNKQDILLDNCF